MLKKLTALVLALLATACLTVTAWADYDYIDQYDITVAPNTEDGSLSITVTLTWTALEELPYGQELKIGIPNGSIREETALTDNIERLAYDNSYMYVYLTQGYDAGETFTFSYSWAQEYMYRLDGSTVTYDYTAGWFDEAKIGEMTLMWYNPANVTGSLNVTGTAEGTDFPTDDGLFRSAENLGYGKTMGITARYENWPTQLSEEYSADNAPGGGWNGGDDDYYDDYDDGSDALIGLLVFLVILFVVLRVVARYGDGYAGGFGTRYVFVNHLWYPAGPDGKPRPGSVGTKERPRPPKGGGGFGGGSRGGGFGGGGFGGGSHCACASSCACACACACAGGGRAGCSAKNLYGAVKLDEDLSEKV